MTKKSGVCAFCGRKAKDVRLLIQGLDAEICDICAEQAHLIVKEQFGNEDKTFSSTGFALKKPKPWRESRESAHFAVRKPPKHG